MTPMIFCALAFEWRKDSARTFDTKLCSFAYSCIVFLLFSLILGLSANARETVATDTPSALAISFIVIC